MKHHELWESMSVNPKDQYPSDALLQTISTIENICNCGERGLTLNTLLALLLNFCVWLHEQKRSRNSKKTVNHWR